MSAKEIRHTAVAWLERRERPDWSAEDQAALEVWLAEPNNMVAYLRAEAGWQRTGRLTALRRPARQPMRAERAPARNGVWPLLRGAAAALVLAALVGTLVWQQWDIPAEETYATGIGSRKTITFADGTRVELNTGTVLRLSRNSAERKAWLDKGEAYFEVEHDANRPFIVIAQGRKVTDLGTKFTVRQDAGKLHVAVVEGLVEVEAKGKKPQSLLKPGYVLTATAQEQSVTRKSLRTILAALDWKHGKLFLENATLAEAAAEFNRYNTRKLVIADPKAAKLIIAGTFHAANPDAFANIAKDVFGLKAKKTKDQIILSH